ncbi:hypothetical protein L226DRAFT_534258 [Lentinus tigrinus ALCF2SS1-7]|uniref:Uncharacterized protein n=1 Tax=Lentinus tigrinus ALCF2SS1-6 TaxID=1328759 RepID=A0A5C2SE51_9APHY|nr:hypothetical protein L227DRAFT_574040 [Lentinus tigrinus ALCF2SS1-6]RPD76208.1 hypothetical protein L226DRAFT_534258 [Lentinus tigrinus ALCF2SS1-7]
MEWLVAVPTFPKPPNPNTEIPPILGHRFFRYQPMQRVYSFTLRLGRCANHPSDSRKPPVRWADIPYDDSESSWDTFSRPLRTRVFQQGAGEDSSDPRFRGPQSDYTGVRGAFTPCPLNAGTLVVHIVPRKPERESVEAGTVRVQMEMKATPLPSSNEVWTIDAGSLVGKHLKSWTPSTLPPRRCDDDRVGVYLRAFWDETRLFRMLMDASPRLSEGEVVDEIRGQLEEATSSKFACALSVIA